MTVTIRFLAHQIVDFFRRAGNRGVERSIGAFRADGLQTTLTRGKPFIINQVQLGLLLVDEFAPRRSLHGATLSCPSERLLIPRNL